MNRIVTFAIVMLIGGYGVAQAEVAKSRERLAQEQQGNEEQACGEMKEAMMREAEMKEAQMEEATKTEDATNDFLGLKWGAGIGVIGRFGGDQAVEKASVVNGTVRVEEEGDLHPRMFLEMHAFLRGNKVKYWRQYQREKAAYRMGEASDLKVAYSAGEDKPVVKDEPPTVHEPPLMGFGPFVALQSGDKKAIDSLAVGIMWGFRKDPKASSSVNVGVGLSFDPSVQALGGGLKEGKPLPTGEKEIRFKKESQFGWAVMTSFTF